MFDFTRGLSETETTCGKRWLSPDVWTEVGLSKYFEQSTWLLVFEHSGRIEQDIWTKYLNKGCLNKMFE